MQVTSSVVKPYTPRSPQPTPNYQDSLQGDRFDFGYPSGSPSEPSDTPMELPEENAPKLERPVLLVHGFNGAPSNWQNMRTWLTRGGDNPDGGVVGPQTTAPDARGKVFTLEFTRPFNPVASNAQELKAAIDRITAATGHKEIDIVAHSMGGLDTRAYLDQNAQEKVGKLVMIGTPNHGSVLADLELVFREHGIAIKPQSDDADIRQALKDLTEVRGDNNPTLNHLNANLERQRSRADMLVIAGNGRPTLSKRTVITLRGDGVVAQHSAKLPGVTHRNIWWTDHSGVKEHPDALRLTGAFLTGRALPAEQQEPPDIPPDRQVAPEEILADKERVHYILNQ